MTTKLDRAVLDFVQTFSGPGRFLGVEPKMERADKTDPNSKQVQASDKNGVLKWTAEVAVKVKVFDRERSEILIITLTSQDEPCKNLQAGQPVMVEGLEMGIMKQDRGGFSQFFSATGIRQVAAQQHSHTSSGSALPQSSGSAAYSQKTQ